MAKMYIGVDNGTTGSIGIVSDSLCEFHLTPIKKEQNYTKKKDIISRIDYQAMVSLVSSAMNKIGAAPAECLAILERPMLNPQRWSASVSAARSIEATQLTLEIMGIPYMFVDSKEWQKTQLPKGLTGSPELKKASMDIGSRLYPQYKDLITKHKDADGLLIAHHAYREKY